MCQPIGDLHILTALWHKLRVEVHTDAAVYTQPSGISCKLAKSSSSLRGETLRTAKRERERFEAKFGSGESKWLYPLDPVTGQQL